MAETNNLKRNYLYGVKFDLQIVISKVYREIIDAIAKRFDFKEVILLEKEDKFIVAFDSILKRDGFITAITPYLTDDIKYSYVERIKE